MACYVLECIFRHVVPCGTEPTATITARKGAAECLRLPRHYIGPSARQLAAATRRGRRPSAQRKEGDAPRKGRRTGQHKVSIIIYYNRYYITKGCATEGTPSLPSHRNPPCSRQDAPPRRVTAARNDDHSPQRSRRTLHRPAGCAAFRTGRRPRQGCRATIISI